jgi:FkbM family methyltransferase
VHGFEPTPQTYDMAVKNIALAHSQKDSDMLKPWHENSSFVVTGDITTHNIGLGDVPGSFDILIKKDNAGHNHIENIHVPLPSGRPRTRKVEPPKVTVEVKTVDSFDFQDVDIIKIDTEGYEFPIVKGAEQTILKWKPIVQLEMVDGQPERFGFSCQEIYDWFLSRDFVITLSDGTDAGIKWEHYTKKMERFFIHKDLISTHPVFHETSTVPSSVEKAQKEQAQKAKQEQSKLVDSLFEQV